MGATTLTSSLVVRLIDQVTGPAKGVGRALLGLDKAARGNFGERLNAAIARNNAALDGARAGLVDAVAGFYALKSAIAAPISAAMNFESAMADIGKVSGFDAAGLDEYGKRLRKLAVTEIPMAVDDLAALSAAAAQAGVPDEDLVDFTRMVAKAAVAWEMSGAEAGEALAKIRTALGLTNEQTAAYADAVNFVSDATAASSRDLIDFTKRVAAQGEFFGYTKEETLAFGAAMISAGAEADVAATSFRNMGKALTRGAGAKKAQLKAYHILGLNSKKVAKEMQKDAVGTTLKVIEKIGKIPKHMQAAVMSDLFGDEARALAPLLGDVEQLRKALALTADEQKYLNSVGKEFEKRSATSAYKLQRFKSQLGDIALVIGGALLPAMNQMLVPLGEIAMKFSNWAEANPELVRSVIAATGAVVGFRVAAVSLKFLGLIGRGGALSMMAFGFNTVGVAALAAGRGLKALAIAPIIAGLAGARRALVGFAASAAILGPRGAVAIAFKSMGAAVMGLLSPLRLVRGAAVLLRGALMFTGVGAVLAAIAAAGTLIYNNWDGLVAFFQGVGSGFMTALEPVKGVIEPIARFSGEILSSITGLLGPLQATNAEWKSWGETLGGAVGGAIRTVIDAINSLIGVLSAAYDKAVAMGAAIKSAVTWGGGDSGGGEPTVDAMGNVTGHRKAGGSVWPGGSFVVGDGGEPEVFTPKTGGTITPMSKMGGSVSWSGNIIVQGNSDPIETARQVARAVDTKLREMLRGAHVDTEARI